MMASRFRSMSIQRRILAGYGVVVGLLLAPAVYAVICLHWVAGQAERSLSNGLDRLRALESLQAEFDFASKFEGIAGALGEADDPLVRQRAQASFDRLRRLYARARPQFLYQRSDGTPQMDVLLGFGEGLQKSSDGRAPGPPWTEAELGEIREEI